MLLQIMEEGHLSDAKGRKVDFRNAIIVMTSNVGADVIRRQTSIGFSLKQDENLEEEQAYDEMRKKLMESLKKVFRPEFINRVDNVIVFRALNMQDITQIVDLELDKVSLRMQEHEIELSATPEALEKLAELGFDPEMGARPLRRVIQQKVEDKLSDQFLAGQFEGCTRIVVDLEDDDIVLRQADPDEIEQTEGEAVPAG
jgi:ATP-dependent Clp protease ATP-binding subunit ClpC